MALSTPIFREQLKVFEDRLFNAAGERFEGFKTGLPAAWEGYKGALRDHALERLNTPAWDPASFGNGQILGAVIRGIEITRSPKSAENNLTRWEGQWGHANRSHHALLEARTNPDRAAAFDAALYAHFRADEDPSASFPKLVALAGARYDLLAYLFFVRDWDRFMPIATRTFDTAFAQLGLDLTMSANASWVNYRAYNAALNEIRQALAEYADITDARLIDAHSFCWMLVRPEFADGYDAVKPPAHAKRDPGRTLDAWEKSIAIMAMRAAEIARYANGQKVEVTKKTKEIHFNQVELEAYIKTRLHLQENRCALTGIPLQPYGQETDQALLPSLDRIDSDGHYAKDNLQVVCRFVNGWKSSTADEEFRRLLTLVREGATE